MVVAPAEDTTQLLIRLPKLPDRLLYAQICILILQAVLGIIGVLGFLRKVHHFPNRFDDILE